MILINHNLYLIDVNKLFSCVLNIEWFCSNDEIIYMNDTFQLKVELYFYYNVIFLLIAIFNLYFFTHKLKYTLFILYNFY